MSNPNRPPLFATSDALGTTLSDAFMNWNDEDRMAYLKDVGYGSPVVARVLGYFRTYGPPPFAEGRGPGVDVVEAHSVSCPSEWSHDPDVRLKGQTFLWSTRRVGEEVSKKTGQYNERPLYLRKRSDVALTVIDQFFRLLPWERELEGLGLHPEHHRRFTREALAEGSLDKLYATGTTWNTVGRLVKAIPLKGSTIPEPPTRREVRTALRECGLDLVHNGAVPGPLLLSTLNTPDSFYINTKSDNGCPVGGKWDTPGAADKVAALTRKLEAEVRARVVRGDIEATKERVYAYMRELEATQPWLTAFTGKCKGDFYSRRKVADSAMRFYNVVPRQLVLIMQTVTKPLGMNKTHLLAGGHSAMGVSLHHGGAAAVIAQMDAQLLTSGHAYMHVGDDTFCAIRVGPHTVAFSLDCSNFDLTQHADMTAEVHQGLFEVLARIDPAAAAVWYAFARERVVVCFGAGAMRFRHCGPSGLPIQSYVNDVIMEIVCARLFAALKPAQALDRGQLDAVIQSIGRGMGLAIRLEDHLVGETRSLRDLLAIAPFLFIGSYFYTDPHHGVAVFCDVVRTMAQARYPKEYEKSTREFRTKEAIRLCSVGINMGLPPGFLRPAFSAFFSYALPLLDMELQVGNVVEPGTLYWLQTVTDTGPAACASMSGLRDAFARIATRPAEHWLVPRSLPLRPDEDLGGTSEWIPLAEPRPSAQVVNLSRRAVVHRRDPPTHPLTDDNWGRPPTTAIWGPNKPPRPPRPGGTDALTQLAGLRSGRGQQGGGRGKRTAMEFFSDDFSPDWGSESDDYDRFQTGYE